MKKLLACLPLLLGIALAQKAPAKDAPPAAAPTASGPSTAAAAAPTASDQARAALRAKKSEYIAKNLPMSPDEAVAFWPVYKKYEGDYAKLNDDRVALIKKYTEGAEKADPKLAETWLQTSLQRDVQLAKLRLDYLPQFSKVLPPEKVTRFFQVDHALTAFAEIKIATMVGPAAPIELPPAK